MSRIDRGSPDRSEAPARSPGRLLHWLINLLVAAVWLGFAWGVLRLWQSTHAPLQLILFVRNSTLTLLFLCRRRSGLTSQSVKEWLVAVVGTFAGYIFGEGTPLVTGVTTPLMLVSAVLMTVSIVALGRSFGIVPANRGVKTRGPYALVRHPIYACYFLFDLGYLLSALSPRNILVFAAIVLSFHLRSKYEERLLLRDPFYAAYAERTRYRFVPGIL